MKWNIAIWWINPIIFKLTPDVKKRLNDLSLSNDVLTALNNDLKDINSDLFKYFDEGVDKLKDRVDAWKILDDAGTSLKNNVLAIEKVDFLRSKGFNNENLIKLGQANDIKVLEFAEGFTARNLSQSSIMNTHTKMLAIKAISDVNEFSQYQDNVNNLIKAHIIKTEDNSKDFLLTNPMF